MNLTTDKIKVSIVDDHPMVIEGLKALLCDEEKIALQEMYNNGTSLLKGLKESVPDVILLDINLPDISGIQLCKEIKTTYPSIKIIGVSNYSEPGMIKGMIRSGVDGYLLKNITGEELVKAIEKVNAGQESYSAEALKVMVASINEEEESLPKLTRRELSVLALIAKGRTTNQIADKLFISPLTVETHRRNLMKKFNVSNAAALVKLALDGGLIE